MAASLPLDNFIFACVHGYAACAGGGQTSISGDGPQVLSAYVSGTGSLPWDPRFVEEVNLTAQGDSGIYLFLCPLPPECWDYKKRHPVQFFIWVQGLELGPPCCVTNTLLAEPSSQPGKLHLWCFTSLFNLCVLLLQPLRRYFTKTRFISHSSGIWKAPDHHGK